jgi:hypothetical protein
MGAFHTTVYGLTSVAVVGWGSPLQQNIKVMS